MPTIISTKRSTPSILPIAKPVLNWIDRELLHVSKSFSSAKANVLLELRQVFKQSSAKAILTKFYRLLPRLERRYFLLGFRIRQWVSLNFNLEASDPLNRVGPENFSISPLARVLPRVKSLFFEFTTEKIPFNDIRVTVRPAA
ncbi:MAG TPA: hypothetical protein DDW68_12655 [Verrucomicrobiales bacterium]|nr:hypothetical protein [Verrucomicrobiales bacterium]HBE98010.1 hypothetical protein [Verrucomicrobiales bacterium]